MRHQGVTGGQLVVATVRNLANALPIAWPRTARVRAKLFIKRERTILCGLSCVECAEIFACRATRSAVAARRPRSKLTLGLAKISARGLQRTTDGGRFANTKSARNGDPQFALEQ